MDDIGSGYGALPDLTRLSQCDQCTALKVHIKTLESEIQQERTYRENANALRAMAETHVGKIEAALGRAVMERDDALQAAVEEIDNRDKARAYAKELETRLAEIESASDDEAVFGDHNLIPHYKASIEKAERIKEMDAKRIKEMDAENAKLKRLLEEDVLSGPDAPTPIGKGGE